MKLHKKDEIFKFFTHFHEKWTKIDKKSYFVITISYFFIYQFTSLSVGDATIIDDCDANT